MAAATLRVLGGWWPTGMTALRLLAVVFRCARVGAAVLALAPGLPVYLAGIYLISAACGIGNGAVFKLVPTYFLGQAGPV